MTINHSKLFIDPDAAKARIAELRESVATLHLLVGPELRKFMDSHDFPFSTMNALLKYGERLMKVVAVLKESVVKLQELAETKLSTDIQHAPFGPRGE